MVLSLSLFLLPFFIVSLLFLFFKACRLQQLSAVVARCCPLGTSTRHHRLNLSVFVFYGCFLFSLLANRLAIFIQFSKFIQLGAVVPCCNYILAYISRFVNLFFNFFKLKIAQNIFIFLCNINKAEKILTCVRTY